MVKDFRIEQLLDREGVTWAYHESIPLESIDAARSLQNQARLGQPLDEATVEAYAIRMLDGFAFPALVGYPSRTGWRLNDGNHRYKAKLEAGLTDTDLYEVRSDDEWVLSRVTRVLNTMEGRRESREALIEHGKHLVREFGRTVTEVERALGLPRDAVQVALRQDMGRSRVQSVGLEPRAFSKTALLRLNAIQSDRSLAEAARVVQEASLTAEATEDLVAAVRRARTEEEQLATIAAFRARPEYQERVADTGRGRRITRERAPKTIWFSAVQSAINLMEQYPSLHTMSITTDEDRRRFNELVNQFIAWVNHVRGGMNGTAIGRGNAETGTLGREAAHHG